MARPTGWGLSVLLGVLLGNLRTLLRVLLGALCILLRVLLALSILLGILLLILRGVLRSRSRLCAGLHTRSEFLLFRIAVVVGIPGSCEVRGGDRRGPYAVTSRCCDDREGEESSGISQDWY